ncbi:glucose-6-phosphate dehydrogenase assembly protein OpcA [Demequina pelophila]|uniref:glucose-6-phosphate dehydrogenase assembly protein OpcA n=1 Tax=Demequina pelophila TaxID=1638984 RepID=UPI0007808D45|nr:glucose-6-phosphate dehydrogenase assembly protein OpcA [Demequina pelophila]
MIITLPQTTTAEINARLVESRMDYGVVTLARVMTLVIDATGADAEQAIRTANVASREHPCRIVVISPGDSAEARLDAEIRVGGDAGASEVIVLRPAGEQIDHQDTLVTPLLLPDAPIVAWWPADVPADMAGCALGRMAQRRITDTKGEEDPTAVLLSLARCYRPGDTDLAWTRLTRWRALLASALDQVPDPRVSVARMHGDFNSPSILLLGAWLRRALGCEIEATYDASVTALQSITLETPSGPVSISRPDGRNATLSQPGQPDHVITLPARALDEALAEELRRLDDDALYGEVLASFASETVVPL